MENTEPKKTSMKFWRVWLIIAAVAALVIINMQKNRNLNNVTEGIRSGKVLSMVSPQQYFSASWFGKKCPDFTVTTLEGKQISLSSLAGKQVMLVFWATWCPPCRAEIPHIVELREKIAADKLEIIGLSFENPRVVQDFVKDRDINYTIATAQPQDLPEPFGRVAALPTMFFIDAAGNLKIAFEGTVTPQQMRGIIDAE